MLILLVCHSSKLVGDEALLLAVTDYTSVGEMGQTSRWRYSATARQLTRAVYAGFVALN